VEISNSDGPAIYEHGGTTITHMLVAKEKLRHETAGSYLEFVSDFTLQKGAALEPHSHNSDEFYYMLEGEAIMTVGDEEQRVVKGDLIRTPPNTIHTIRTIGDGTFRAIAFATSYMAEGEAGYTAYPPDGEPHFVSSFDD
jgi:quercetin dioxygenase-like cupin family protein